MRKGIVSIIIGTGLLYAQTVTAADTTTQGQTLQIAKSADASAAEETMSGATKKATKHKKSTKHSAKHNVKNKKMKTSNHVTDQNMRKVSSDSYYNARETRTNYEVINKEMPASRDFGMDHH